MSLTPSERMFLENLTIKYLKCSKNSVCKKYITILLVLVRFNLLLNKLEGAVKKIDENRQRTACDNRLCNALQAALGKLPKDCKNCNRIYCALILDPRHKFGIFRISEWGQEMASESLHKFETIYKELYFVSQSNIEPDNESEDDHFEDDGDLDGETRSTYICKLHYI